MASTCTGFSANYFNEHWQYNTLNQMTEIDTGAGNAMFARYNFSATANSGQVVSGDDARQTGANIVYTYDALKRLTKAATTSWTQNIGYDGFGNITSKDVPPNSAEPAFPGAVSSKNRLMQTPDGNGRLELTKFHSPSNQGDNRHAPHARDLPRGSAYKQSGAPGCPAPPGPLGRCDRCPRGVG